MSNDKDEIILISISGHDKPGVTSALTGILGKFGSTNSVVFVLSSELYDPTDYIEDFNEYKALLSNND